MENKKVLRRSVEQVSSSEFKNNYGKYVKQIQDTDQPIDITKNGKVILTVSPPKKPDKLAMLESLVGIIPDEGQTIESAREERLREKYGLDD